MNARLLKKLKVGDTVTGRVYSGVVTKIHERPTVKCYGAGVARVPYTPPLRALPMLTVRTGTHAEEIFTHLHFTQIEGGA